MVMPKHLLCVIQERFVKTFHRNRWRWSEKFVSEHQNVGKCESFVAFINRWLLVCCVLFVVIWTEKEEKKDGNGTSVRWFSTKKWWRNTKCRSEKPPVSHFMPQSCLFQRTISCQALDVPLPGNRWFVALQVIIPCPAKHYPMAEKASSICL